MRQQSSWQTDCTLLELQEVVKQGTRIPFNRAEMPLEARIDGKQVDHTSQRKIPAIKRKIPESLGNRACCVSIGR